jgi:hypothetical protein
MGSTDDEKAEAFQFDSTRGCWWEFWHGHVD